MFLSVFKNPDGKTVIISIGEIFYENYLQAYNVLNKSHNYSIIGDNCKYVEEEEFIVIDKKCYRL